MDSTSFLPSIVFFVALGAIFGVVGSVIARRFGRAMLLLTWLIASAALGAQGAVRIVSLQRALGRGPDVVSAPGMFALLIVAMLLMLGVPTFQIWRRATAESPIAYPRRAAAGVGWLGLGLLLTIALSIVLDLAGVPFIPTSLVH